MVEERVMDPTVERARAERDEAIARRKELLAGDLNRDPRRMTAAHQPGVFASFLRGIPFVGWLFGRAYVAWHGGSIHRQVHNVQNIKRVPAVRENFALTRKWASKGMGPGTRARMARGVLKRPMKLYRR